ncbi:cytochrome b [Gymnodinialimonas sp. 2305UL16-5]|uniref:cytochrome b n=1 Tax=Gymnodinialimonas mytili TaxID=3126503 RepID=UPI00309D18D4
MTTYDVLSRLNHWILAVLIVAMLGFGFYLAYGGVPVPEKLSMIATHKAVGVVVMVLAVWRIGYRLVQGFALPVGTMPPWQARASHLSHVVLLVSLALMPISGLIMGMFSGIPTDVFGIVTIPAFERVDAISAAARMAHKYIAYLFAATLAVHIAAALKHHLIDKDSTLIRMVRG